MCRPYSFGRPSIEEWPGLWKFDERDTDVTDEEFYAAYKSLREYLSTLGKSGIEDDCDFYVRGDPYGDKTQHIEIVNPNALIIDFLSSLQTWLRRKYPAWRIVIPTFTTPNAVIVIYPDAIRFTAQYEANLAAALPQIIETMLSLDDYQHARRKVGQ